MLIISVCSTANLKLGRGLTSVTKFPSDRNWTWRLARSEPPTCSSSRTAPSSNWTASLSWSTRTQIRSSETYLSTDSATQSNFTGKLIFCSDHWKRGGGDFVFGCVLVFLLFVFHAKSGTADNHRNGLSDVSY